MTNGDSLFGVVKVHRLFDLVVRSDFEGHDLQSDEPRRHGEHLGPVGRLVQVLPGLGVRHTCRIAAHNVKVGSGYHASSAVPLNLHVLREKPGNGTRPQFTDCFQTRIMKDEREVVF